MVFSIEMTVIPMRHNVATSRGSRKAGRLQSLHHQELWQCRMSGFWNAFWNATDHPSPLGLKTDKKFAHTHVVPGYQNACASQVKSVVGSQSGGTQMLSDPNPANKSFWTIRTIPLASKKISAGSYHDPFFSQNKCLDYSTETNLDGSVAFCT